MANVGKKRLAEFQWHVLNTLKSAPQGLYWKDLFTRLDGVLPPTEFELGNYESNGNQRRPYIIRFATIGLVKAGWLVKDQGSWSITEDGVQALGQYKTPEDLQRQSRKMYKEWKAGRADEENPDEISDRDQEQEIAMVASIEEAEDNALSIVHEYMGNMDPYLFQDLIAALLEGMGYHVGWVSPPGKDGGLDIVAFQDPLGATGRRIKVQVKRRADKAGAESIRSFLGVLSEDDIGLYVCTGGFSPDAERTAREQEKKRLRLLDGKDLFNLWVDNYEKLPQDKRALMPLKPIYYLNLRG
jgi:restriction system protein